MRWKKWKNNSRGLTENTYNTILNINFIIKYKPSFSLPYIDFLMKAFSEFLSLNKNEANVPKNFLTRKIV